MSFFTDTTNAPKIMSEGFKYREPLSWYQVTDSTVTGFHRTVSEVNYEFRGLSYTAADSIATTKAATSSPYSDSFIVTAHWQRSSEAGHYSVIVNEKSRAAWVADS